MQIPVKNIDDYIPEVLWISVLNIYKETLVIIRNRIEFFDANSSGLPLVGFSGFDAELDHGRYEYTGVEIGN